MVGGLGSDSEVEPRPHWEGQEEEQDYLADGSEGEGLAGAIHAKTDGKCFLRKVYSEELYGPTRPRGTRQGPYVEGEDQKMLQVEVELS